MALVVCTSSFVHLHRHYPGVLSSESSLFRVRQRVLTTCYSEVAPAPVAVGIFSPEGTSPILDNESDKPVKQHPESWLV